MAADQPPQPLHRSRGLGEPIRVRSPCGHGRDPRISDRPGRDDGRPLRRAPVPLLALTGAGRIMGCRKRTTTCLEELMRLDSRARLALTLLAITAIGACAS